MGTSTHDDTREAQRKASAAQAESPKPRHRPNQDEDRKLAESRPGEDGIGQEPRGVQKDIADADKIARTGTPDEPVRNTPPAGKWNETSPD